MKPNRAWHEVIIVFAETGDDKISEVRKKNSICFE